MSSSMSFLIKCFGIGISLALVGCQTTQSSHQVLTPIEDLTPPSMLSDAYRPSTTSSGNARQSQAVITVHVAQQKAEPELLPVQVEQNTLFALPQPMFTQGDMVKVSPVTTADQRSFLLLELKPAAIERLQLLRQQAKGHYFLLSVNGQLVSVNRIEVGSSETGLIMAMSSPQHARQVLHLMQSKPS